VTALVRRFGADIMHIFNAVLLERRLLFLGVKGTSAADVGACVLAAAHLVCPPLAAAEPEMNADSEPASAGSAGAAASDARGGVVTRCYPYANLNDLGFLERKG
jgi:hypothetical protein